MFNNENFRQLLQSIFFWIFITIFFVVVRSYGHEEILNVPPFNPIDIFPELILSSIILGSLIFSIDIFFQKFIEKRVSYLALVILKSFSYLMLLFCGSLLFNILEVMIEGNSIISFESLFTEYFVDNKLNTFVTYLFFSVVFIQYNFYQQIKSRFSPRVLSKIFLGKFHQPREVHRIFMFIDLKSSTTYAEKLGHIKYSELIRDCFEDLSESVLKYKSEIYQYVGDGVVLTWDIKHGLQNNNCFRLFFSFKNSINKRKINYIEKYAFIPEFKAGLNMGIVTVTEVGKYKKELAYHGDAINTAARIQDKCSEFNNEFLISESLQGELATETDFNTKFKGSIALRGKLKPVKIYAVSR